ncbi:hypothetical protein ACGFJC_46995 [Nonomuraea fuscirosea]|uniref:hypothetical protein n=1 Tax=Nonomuraea fuscirosea TaxID=1291556 RepID=UPI00371E9A42
MPTVTSMHWSNDPRVDHAQHRPSTVDGHAHCTCQTMPADQVDGTGALWAAFDQHMTAIQAALDLTQDDTPPASLP